MCAFSLHILFRDCKLESQSHICGLTTQSWWHIVGLSPPAEFWGGLGQNSDKHLNSEWPPHSHFAKQNSARPDCLQTAICATGRILLRLTPKLHAEASRRFIVLRQRRRAENLTVFRSTQGATRGLQSAICDLHLRPGSSTLGSRGHCGRRCAVAWARNACSDPRRSPTNLLGERHRRAAAPGLHFGVGSAPVHEPSTPTVRLCCAIVATSRRDGFGFEYHPACLARPGELAPALVSPRVGTTLPQRSPLLAPAPPLRSQTRCGSLAQPRPSLRAFSKRAGAARAGTQPCGFPRRRAGAPLVHVRVHPRPRGATTPQPTLGVSSWL